MNSYFEIWAFICLYLFFVFIAKKIFTISYTVRNEKIVLHTLVLLETFIDKKYKKHTKTENGVI